MQGHCQLVHQREGFGVLHPGKRLRLTQAGGGGGLRGDGGQFRPIHKFISDTLRIKEVLFNDHNMSVRVIWSVPGKADFSQHCPKTTFHDDKNELRSVLSNR